MGDIKFDASFASSIRTKLSSVESTVEKAKNRTKSAHAVLWADEALTNAFSKSLIADINSAAGKMKKQQELMAQYSTAMKLAEQDLSSADSDSAKTTIKKIFAWTWFVSGVTPIVGLPVAIGGILWDHYHSSSSVVSGQATPARSIGDAGANVGKATVDQATEAAQQVIDETPQYIPFSNESVHDYSEGVSRGSIRYVDQTTNLKENGWGDTADLPRYTDGHPGGQCNSACESMALSYMGIDRSPGSLVPTGYDELGGLEVANYGTGTREWIAPDGSTVRIENNAYCDLADIRNRISNFEMDGGRGDTAPVMLHYRNGNNMHWILVTGENSDGSFNVIGPGGVKERGTTITIDSYGNIRGEGISHGGGYIDKYAQYSREN